MDFGTSSRAAALAFALVAAACAPVAPGPPGVPQMAVRSFLDIRHLCYLGVSPPIELDGAPYAAAVYRIRLVNEGVLYAPPADFEIKAEGSAIGEGALAGYRGPCPGEAQSFTYRIDVLALDRSGRPLAFGQTKVTAESTTRLMRLSPGRRPRMPEPVVQSP